MKTKLSIRLTVQDLISIIRMGMLLCLLLCRNISWTQENSLSSEQKKKIITDRSQILQTLKDSLKDVITNTTSNLDIESKAKVYLDLGKAYTESFESDTASYILDKAESLYASNPHISKATIAGIFYYKGLHLRHLGNLKEALIYTHKGIDVLKSSSSSSLQEDSIKANLYFQTAVVFWQSKKFESALEYSEKTSLILNNNDQRLKANNLILQGVILSEKNKENADSSIALFNAAKAIAKSYNIPNIYVSALINAGVTYYQIDSSDKALALLEEALVYKDYDDEYLRSSIYSTIGEIYFTKGLYKKSESFLLKALKRGERLKQQDIAFYAHGFLAKTYKALGQFEKANYHLEQYYQLKIEREGKEKHRELMELEHDFKTAEKDKEIISKNLELEKQKNKLTRYTFIGGSVLLVLGFSIFGLRRRHQNKISNMMQEQQINNLKSVMTGEESERSRIAGELHDGIGAMIAAAKMNIENILEQHPQIASLKEVNIHLDKTSQEIRSMAHNLVPSVLQNNTLETALILYCNRLMTHAALDIEIQTDEHLPNFNENAKLTLYRVFQELLQNIIKHSNASRTYIQIRKNADELLIIVEDNGKGFDTEKLSDGLGLKNIQSRIHVFDGSFEMQSSSGWGSTFVITCPIDKLV